MHKREVIANAYFDFMDTSDYIGPFCRKRLWWALGEKFYTVMPCGTVRCMDHLTNDIRRGEEVPIAQSTYVFDILYRYLFKMFSEDISKKVSEDDTLEETSEDDTLEDISEEILEDSFEMINDTIKKIFKVDILNRYEDDFDKRIETMIDEEILCTREDVFNKKLEMTFGKVEKIDNIIEYKLYACARMYLSGLLFVPIDMIEHPDTKSPTPFGQFVRWFLFRAFENLDGVDIFNISTCDCGCRNCE